MIFFFFLVKSLILNRPTLHIKIYLSLQTYASYHALIPGLSPFSIYNARLGKQTCLAAADVWEARDLFLF